MKITQVTYERRSSDGNYGNRTIHLVAELEEGDDAHGALDHLRAVATEQLARDVADEDAARQRQVEQHRAAYRKAELDTQPTPIGTGDGSIEGLR